MDLILHTMSFSFDQEKSREKVLVNRIRFVNVYAEPTHVYVIRWL